MAFISKLSFRLRLAWVLAFAQPLLSAPQQADIPKEFKAPVAANDYIRREVMVPMRDGVKLYTVVVVPKGAKDAPILLTRTPYNASRRASRNESTHMVAILPQADEVFVAGGYIRAFQD